MTDLTKWSHDVCQRLAEQAIDPVADLEQPQLNLMAEAACVITAQTLRIRQQADRLARLEQEMFALKAHALNAQRYDWLKTYGFYKNIDDLDARIDDAIAKGDA
jgi:hypothetical protein